MTSRIQSIIAIVLALSPLGCVTEVDGDPVDDEEGWDDVEGEYDVQASCNPSATTGPSAPRPMIAAKWFEAVAPDTMWLTFGDWRGPNSSAYAEYFTDPAGGNPDVERGTYTFLPSPCNRQVLVIRPSTGGQLTWDLSYLAGGAGPSDDRLRLFFDNPPGIGDYEVRLRRCLYARCPG